MEWLGCWLGVRLISCAGLGVLWAGCRSVVGRVQIDVLWHHMLSGRGVGSDTWAMFERDSGVWVGGDDIEKARRAISKSCKEKKKKETSYNTSSGESEMWVCGGCLQRIVAAPLRMFLICGVCSRQVCNVVLLAGPSTVQC